uniref:Uncharacterized protein n=1 Tax=Tetraselmis sp. GSL018 TaxID=582737 RepID=A0A061S7P4_9CHLO
MFNYCILNSQEEKMLCNVGGGFALVETRFFSENFELTHYF